MIVRLLVALVAAVIVYLVFAALVDGKDEDLLAGIAALVTFLLVFLSPLTEFGNRNRV